MKNQNSNQNSNSLGKKSKPSQNWSFEIFRQTQITPRAWELANTGLEQHR
jgi:hypothetical protein